MTRIAVWLCTCDDRVAKGIDVEQVAGALRGEALVLTTPHVCLPDGLAALTRELVAQNVERVVVAACPERFQAPRLRGACGQAGVNPNHFALVDWREGCAWAHRGDRAGATAHALDLVRMGLARVANAAPLDGVLTYIHPHALVVGGGPAGLSAARLLAQRGLDVTLIEREPELGGAARLRPLNRLGPHLNSLRDAVLHDPHMNVSLNSRVVGVEGAPGCYRVRVANGRGSREIQAGAVVIATGSQEYRRPGLYCHDGRRVLTLSEFQAALHDGAPDARSLVYLLCAGSRDEHVGYCSRTCCLDALEQAVRVKRANPALEITILFRELYLGGEEPNEEPVREARRLGIEFVRYAAGKPPRVQDDFVVVTDAAGRTCLFCADRVILATAQVPRDDAGQLARLFHLPRDADGFFIEPHPRVRPEERRERGVFIAGSAHRPADAETALSQGLMAGARAARFLQQRELMRPASAARVDSLLCTGCAQCVETCGLSAIQMTAATARGTDSVLDRATIDPFLCQECGNCAVACPSRAIGLPAQSDKQIFAQIQAALSRAPEQRRVLVFACRWSGFAAMELAGAKRLRWSADARVIELPCSARLDPIHVLYAFLNGAASVLLALCPPDECHFADGNRLAEARIAHLREQLAAQGIDPRRLAVVRLMGDDAPAWVRALNEG